jgi:hypothetical protein
MGAELVFVSEEHIEPAIEPCVIDAGKGDAQQVFERAVGISAFGHFQFTLVAAKARRREDTGDLPFTGQATCYAHVRCAQRRVTPRKTGA